jgi:hypothetical protein
MLTASGSITVHILMKVFSHPLLSIKDTISGEANGRRRTIFNVV